MRMIVASDRDNEDYSTRSTIDYLCIYSYHDPLGLGDNEP